MSLSTELYGLKSAGTYRFEKDQSVMQNTVELLDNVRMLVGFSKIGPFNTPVFITNTKEFTDTFGQIDRSLEKKGAYFHRSCLAALSAGPIYALNLLKLNPDLDKVNVMKLATSSTCEAQTKLPDDNLFPYQGMYNIDTFYTPSEECMLTTVGRSNTYIPAGEGKSTNDILDFTNIGKTPVSVIVTKASDYNASAYNVTAQEWYGKGNVPSFLHDTSYISDFMVDVYVFSGDWGGRFDESEPYARFASDIKFSKYFDKNKGLVRRKSDTDTTDTMFTQFLNEPDVQLIGKYTGCLIPGFVDKNGHNLYIEYLINSDTSVNGLMCAVNEQIFDGDVLIDGEENGIDMIGHTLYDKMHNEKFSDLDFLSYNGSIATRVECKYDGGTFVPSTINYDVNVSTNNVIDTWSSGKQTGSEGTFDMAKVFCTQTGSAKHTLYAYYYDETNNTGSGSVKSYIDMETGNSAAAQCARELEGIYTKVNDGIKSYFIGTDNDGNKILVPVTKVKKSVLYSTTDNSVPSIDYATVNAKLAATYGTQVDPAILNAHPIIKYVFEFTSTDVVLTFDANDEIEYLTLDKIYTVYYGNNEKTKLMFIEGNDIYNKRASLGTNDYLVMPDESKNDIDWFDDTLPLSCFIINGNSYYIVNQAYMPDYVVAKLYTGLTDFDDETIQLSANNINTTIVAYATKNGVTAKPNQFIIPANSNDDAYDNVIVGNYAISRFCEDENDNPVHRLTRIDTITGLPNETGVVDYKLITCQDNVEMLPYGETEDYVVEIFRKLTESFTNYNIFTLSGFELKDYHMPDGTNERQHEILDLLDEESEDSNLYKALIDRELIQFRYLVDTFGYGIESMCKAQYTRLCQGRKSAFAIINMPSVTDFKNSEDPSFLDKNKSVSAEFIAKGGDPTKNPTFLFSLPDKVNGSTWGAYYYPYLKVYSNYTTVSVPPAAYVSNNYVAKYASGSPWTLVAGQTRGVITGNNVVGVESSIIHDNRDWLEPAGINSIVYQNNIGCVIYANKTAQQKPKSALSSINCREVCIYIQDNVEKILRNYLFEINTAQTRLEIKTLVDNFLDTVKNNGGVYDYHTVMDSSNNDAEVIDHNMGVLDIFVEPVRGMEILVQKLTILRTGAIESGSFE